MPACAQYLKGKGKKGEIMKQKNNEMEGRRELLGRQGEQKWMEVGILWLGLDSGMAKRVSRWLHAQDEKFPSMR